MRTPRAIAACLLLSFAPTALPRPVYAQASADDPTTAMARARFKEGVEFYDKGEYEQARASFLQAYALKKHPAVLLNLAWSCLKAGHAIEADKYFKQFLSDSKDITEKQRADANDGLAQSRAKLGRIEVIAGAGTEVTIDGDRVGSTPLAEPIVVEAGAHTIKFKAPDGTVDTQSITVMGGERSVARVKASTASAPAAMAPLPPPATGVPPPAETGAPPSPPPAPPPKPPEESPPHRAGHAHAAETTAEADTGGRSAFATPKNLTPVYLMGGAAILAYGGAGLMLFFKGQAQGKADDATNQIKSRMGSCDENGSAGPNATMTDKLLCSAYHTDVGQVNDDALWGNVLLATGVVLTAGAVIYWIVADKGSDSGRAKAPVLTPVVGPGIGGLSLSGHF